MARMRSRPAVAVLLVAAACSNGAGSAAPVARATPPPPAAASTPAPIPAPTPPLPAYYLESLRARTPTGGKISIGDPMWRGAGYAKFNLSWPSGGQTFTGTITLPDGPGPYPVVIVNHGHIPPERYWNGQDSGIFGDPLAADGFISLAPHYPGYLGSGIGAPGLTTNEQIAVVDQDLISSLASLPQADATKIAVVGHSQGGGVSQILMVVDPRIKAVVLMAPVASDEAENARRLAQRPGAPTPQFGDPDQNADLYRHISPRTYFSAALPPVLLVQGTLDHTIPAAHTQATYDALQKAGVTSKLDWVPGGDHDLVGSDLAFAVSEEEAWIRKAFGI